MSENISHFFPSNSILCFSFPLDSTGLLVKVNLEDKELEQIIIKTLITSTFGIYDENEIASLSENEKYQRLRLICIVKALHTKRRFWVHAIFHEKVRDVDLKSLFDIACDHCPNDLNLRNLIQAQMKCKEGQLGHTQFAVAERLFHKVNEDSK